MNYVIQLQQCTECNEIFQSLSILHYSTVTLIHNLSTIFQVETKDALLHAINEEFVEAVEVLLDHEETIHKPGQLHVSIFLLPRTKLFFLDQINQKFFNHYQSWEDIPPDTANFTPDITPLVLAAHRDNYEIIKILLDRGAILPMPHDVR